VLFSAERLAVLVPALLDHWLEEIRSGGDYEGEGRCYQKGMIEVPQEIILKDDGVDDKGGGVRDDTWRCEWRRI